MAAYGGLVPTVVYRDFEWDSDKAESNVRKHGVAFEEAAIAITDQRSLDFDDRDFPDNLITLAAATGGRILYIVSTVRGDRIRLISAREATRRERDLYEQAE